MLEIKDIFGEVLKLTDEVWDAVIIKHPEVKSLKSYIARTVSEAEVVARSVYNERVVLYYRYFPGILKGKFMVVVVKRVTHNEKYVATIYITDKRKGGELLWPKK